MTRGDTLGRVVERLRAAGIPHMLAGSFASSFHGTPRTTQDIDLVIDPSPDTLRAFVSLLPPEAFYVNLDAALEALQHQGQFNVVDLATGWKVDLIIRKHRPFSVEEFGRRHAADVLDTTVDVASAEDTVLAKLEWARLGESERQLRDVAGIVAVKGASLDRAYIERWAASLGIADLWERVLALVSGER